MLEQKRRKRLRIISHYIDACVLTCQTSSAHDCLRRRMQMLLGSIIAVKSALKKELLPIAGEVDKCQNRKGENDCALYHTVQLPAYLLDGLLVHTIVFAVRCRCSWNQLLLLHELCSRSCCLLQEMQINVRIGKEKTIAHYIALYICRRTYLAAF